MARYIGCILLLVCFGCGASTPAPSPTQTVIETLPPAVEALPTPLPRPGINYPPDPQSVVQSFLSAVQIAAADVEPTVYLTEAYQRRLAGKSVLDAFGAEPFEWFEVKAAQRIDSSTALVTATIHYASSDDQRHFTLTQDPLGIWQINTITP